MESKAQTLSEALQKGEWDCKEPPSAEFTSTSRMTWFPNGEWRQKMTIEGKMPQGFTLFANILSKGSYSVSGDELRSENGTVEVSFKKDGVPFAWPEAEANARKMAAQAGVIRVTSWDDHRLVYTMQSQEVICTR
jgi:hypothetical protein